MLSCLGDYLGRKFDRIPKDAAVNDFLNLLIQVYQSRSLMISIPVLVTWTKLLNNSHLDPVQRFFPFVGPLLEVAMVRLVRYEHLPEDSTDASLLFLLEDTDTQPERHAFLGNYRRYTGQLIEAIVQLRPFEAVSHILSTTENLLHHLYDGEPPLSSKALYIYPHVRRWVLTTKPEPNYSKYSIPALKVDSHFTMIEATLKGFTKHKATNPDPNSQVRALHTCN